MVSDTSTRPLVAIVGPTASGKSALALEMAVRLPGEVVNCDSVQVYRGFDIGSAKLPPGARRGIPHHLIDICRGEETFSAGDFAARARETMAEIAGRERLPVIAGGTGFYLRALFRGLFTGPARDEAVRTRLAQRAQRRPESLHRLLTRLDPAAAGRIHPNDHSKLIRALEVCILARRPMTELHRAAQNALSGYSVFTILLDPPRAEVYQRINQRCVEMFQRGLIEEVSNLLASGVPRSAQPMRAVGYRHAVAVIDGELTEAAAIEKCQQATRNYAKRQWTWFRKEPSDLVLHGFGDDPSLVARAMDAMREFIAPVAR